MSDRTLASIVVYIPQGGDHRLAMGLDIGAVEPRAYVIQKHIGTVRNALRSGGRLVITDQSADGGEVAGLSLDDWRELFPDFDLAHEWGNGMNYTAGKAVRIGDAEKSCHTDPEGEPLYPLYGLKHLLENGKTLADAVAELTWTIPTYRCPDTRFEVEA